MNDLQRNEDNELQCDGIDEPMYNKHDNRTTEFICTLLTHNTLVVVLNDMVMSTEWYMR